MTSGHPLRYLNSGHVRGWYVAHPCALLFDCSYHSNKYSDDDDQIRIESEKVNIAKGSL